MIVRKLNLKFGVSLAYKGLRGKVIRGMNSGTHFRKRDKKLLNKRFIVFHYVNVG